MKEEKPDEPWGLWRSTGVEGQHELEHLRDVSSDELASIGEADRAMHRFRKAVSVFQMVEMNYRALERHHAWAFGLTAGKPNAGYAELATLAFEVNRRLLNYLASCRLFIDFMRREQKSIGKDGFDLFVQATSEAYDNSFAYRLLDQLRNHVQHRGLPAGHVTHQSKADGQGNTVVTGDIYFARDELLEDADIKASVREELRGKDAHLPILALAREYHGLMRQINVVSLAPLVVHYEASFNVLARLYKEGTAKGPGEPTIAKFETRDGQARFDMKRVPWMALDLYQKARKALE